MPVSDYPDFMVTHLNASNPGTVINPSAKNLSADAKIGTRKVEQGQSASPRVGRVQTFIANVAALAIWVLAAIPGASQLVYFYERYGRQGAGNPEKQLESSALPEASKTQVNAQQDTAEQSTATARSELVSLCNLSVKSLKSAFASNEPANIFEHLADFCERRRQIANAKPGLEFSDLMANDNQELKQLVNSKKVQQFLSSCIKGMESMIKTNRVTAEKKSSLTYMLIMIASLKALSAAKENVLISYQSPDAIRF